MELIEEDRIKFDPKGIFHEMYEYITKLLTKDRPELEDFLFFVCYAIQTSSIQNVDAMKMVS